MARMIIPRNLFITVLWRSRRYLIKSVSAPSFVSGERPGDSKEEIYSFGILYASLVYHVYILILIYKRPPHHGAIRIPAVRGRVLGTEDRRAWSILQILPRGLSFRFCGYTLATMAEQCRPRAFPHSPGHRSIIGSVLVRRFYRRSLSVIIPRLSRFSCRAIAQRIPAE